MTDATQTTDPGIGLLERARYGDRGAEALLFERLQARVVSVAKRRVWDEEAARDIAQDTLGTVLAKYREADLTRGFLPWVFTILHHKIGNYLKRRSTERRHSAAVGWLVAGAAVEGGTVAAAVELADLLEKALRRATAECRRVFQLLLADADHARIRREFGGEPMGTTYSRISRCRGKLLKEIERLEKEGNA